MSHNKIIEINATSPDATTTLINPWISSSQDGTQYRRKKKNNFFTNNFNYESDLINMTNEIYHVREVNEPGKYLVSRQYVMNRKERLFDYLTTFKNLVRI